MQKSKENVPGNTHTQKKRQKKIPEQKKKFIFFSTYIMASPNPPSMPYKIECLKS
jgi:hypothetical protein